MKVIEIVIDRSTTLEESLVHVITISVKNRDTKKILDVLCKEVPLEEYELLHLKRVRKKKDENDMVEIVVCPSPSYRTLNASVQDICDQYSKDEVLVAKFSPISKMEFKDWGQYWPINYHPSELERNREKGLSEDEIAVISKFHTKLESDNTNIIQLTNAQFQNHAAFIVNPMTQNILASSMLAYQLLQSRYGQELLYDHKLLTPTMVCIDHLAEMVSGHIPPEAGKYSIYPILKCLFAHSCSSIYLGHVPSDQYLCTGLDLYIYQEPDLMSSMALVHSRIRRVYFIHPDLHEGALLSGNGHIHQLRSLNHHYRVFQLHHSAHNHDNHQDNDKQAVMS